MCVRDVAVNTGLVDVGCKRRRRNAGVCRNHVGCRPSNSRRRAFDQSHAHSSAMLKTGCFALQDECKSVVLYDGHEPTMASGMSAAKKIAGPHAEKLSMAESLADAVGEADYIQEVRRLR